MTMDRGILENLCHLMILHVRAHTDNKQGKYQCYFDCNKDEIKCGVTIKLQFHFGPGFQLLTI